jgi:hypothetical protein
MEIHFRTILMLQIYTIKVYIFLKNVVKFLNFD